MRGEMAYQSGIIDYVRHHHRGIFDFYREGDSDPSSYSARYLDHLVPSGWFCQNQLRCARFMVQRYLPAVDLNRGTVSPTFVRDADTALDAELRHRNPYNFLEHLLLPALGSAARKFAAGQCYVDLARVASALERYRLAHGEYPASLDVLAPQFIAKVPHDIIGGQPLKYRRTDDGQFVLYSIGWNEKDDGGEIALTKSGSIDTANGDWVWRYPAK
jgi:hypothetical protein